MKKSIIILSVLSITLSSCNSQKEKKDYNFKNYFFQPAWFNEAKVYEYEVISNGEKSLMYRGFEKISNKKLKSTIYDNNKLKTGINYYEYINDKVIISDIYTVETWNNNTETKEKVTNNVVFDFKHLNKEFSITQTFRIKDNPNITKKITRTLIEIGEQKFNNNSIKTVIAKGNAEVLIYKNEYYPFDKTITGNEKIVYAENIGVIEEYTNFPNHESKTTLKRILSLKEFEKEKTNASNLYTK